MDFKKTVRLTVVRNELKRTIFVRGELGLLQIVSESDTGRCASEDVGPPRRVDCEIPHRLNNEDVGPPRRVDCEIPHRLDNENVGPPRRVDCEISYRLDNEDVGPPRRVEL